MMRRAMSDRRPYLAANWKMQKTVEETEDFLDRFIGDVGDLADIDIAICPPFTSLRSRRRAVPTKPGQGCRAEHARGRLRRLHRRDLSLDADLARSRRRDPRALRAPRAVRRDRRGAGDQARCRAARRASAHPLRWGEQTTSARRASPRTSFAASSKPTSSRSRDSHLSSIVIAYEPVWAIGTGKTASPEQAEEAIGFARSVVAERDAEASKQIRILYGGSVKPDNAEELLGREEIDGALVGGASLDPADFLAICEAAL